MFDYPYKPGDGRENLKAGDDSARVLRGGQYNHLPGMVRCAHREAERPDSPIPSIGFRVVRAPLRRKG